MFNSCDVLRPYVAHIDDIFKDFTSYKVRVPVTGAIILDETYERVRLLWMKASFVRFYWHIYFLYPIILNFFNAVYTWCCYGTFLSYVLYTLHWQCILVKGWKGSSWSFPRGKKNKDEEDHACAIREVSLALMHSLTVFACLSIYFSIIFEFEL